MLYICFKIKTIHDLQRAGYSGICLFSFDEFSHLSIKKNPTRRSPAGSRLFHSRGRTPPSGPPLLRGRAALRGASRGRGSSAGSPRQGIAASGAFARPTSRAGTGGGRGSAQVRGRAADPVPREDEGCGAGTLRGCGSLRTVLEVRRDRPFGRAGPGHAGTVPPRCGDAHRYRRGSGCAVTPAPSGKG